MEKQKESLTRSAGGDDKKFAGMTDIFVGAGSKPAQNQPDQIAGGFGTRPYTVGQKKTRHFFSSPTSGGFPQWKIRPALMVIVWSFIYNIFV